MASISSAEISMASGNLRERWRYIAFQIEGCPKVGRSDFLGALISASRDTPLANSFRITVFEGDFGILKIPHTLKEEAIKVLRDVGSVGGSPCKVETLKTSGTIKTLKDKYRNRIARLDDITE